MSLNQGGYVQHYQGERRQIWTTPRSLFEELDREFHFSFDGAADDTNALLPNHEATFYLAWTGHRVFCNPPWSNVAPFVELAPTAELAVLLVPARTNAGIYYIIRLTKGHEHPSWGSGPSCGHCGVPLGWLEVSPFCDGNTMTTDYMHPESHCD